MLSSIILSEVLNIIVLWRDLPKIGNSGNVIFKAVFTILIPFVPGLAIARLFGLERQLHDRKLKLKKLLTDSDSKLEDVKNMSANMEDIKSQISQWEKFQSKLLLNENNIENIIQCLVLVVLTLISQSSTTTVEGLVAYLVNENTWLVVCFAIMSIIRIWTGLMNATGVSKGGYLPFTGKILLGLYFLITIASRIFCVVLYLAPCLGLFDFMSHYQNGLAVPDKVGNLTLSWNYKHYTKYSKDEYAIGLALIIALHFSFVFILKLSTSLNFLNGQQKIEKSLHIFGQFICPTVYCDWDVHYTQANGYNFRHYWKHTMAELLAMIILFFVENLSFCVPMWILYSNVVDQNGEFSRHFLPQEWLEDETTNRLFHFSLWVPFGLVFVLIGQVGLLYLYYKFSHPWSRIFELESRK